MSSKKRKTPGKTPDSPDEEEERSINQALFLDNSTSEAETPFLSVQFDQLQHSPIIITITRSIFKFGFTDSKFESRIATNEFMGKPGRCKVATIF